MEDRAVIEACHLSIGGQVQGVGFRPFVHNLALRLGLAGRVSNDGQGVQVDLQGTADQLARFESALWAEVPPMAVVDSLRRTPTGVDPGLRDFTIVRSGGGEVRVSVTPDAAPCPDCLAELFDPADRRYRYPFINCTHCGPRYTLIRKLPYDRPQTTMAAFELCDACRGEYESPADRRFHAQPNACPACGPRLRLLGGDGNERPVPDPVAEAYGRLLGGEILAIKGIGGFHLVCDARNAAAVAELRRRKHRDEKPFALMAANRASLEGWVGLDEAASQRLQAAEGAIVLCPALDPGTLPGIAPGLARLGVMLPHAPLHYLLFYLAAGCPSGTDWLARPQALLLVMTSANPSGEPLVSDNDEAVRRLAGIADAFLVHDRAIHIRCDDSVVHGGHRPPALVRRGRGLAPQVTPLARSGPSTLALGGFFKNTVCLTKGDRAYVSQHIGDLDNPSCCRALEQTVAHLSELLEIRPERVAVDLHPGFHSSDFGRRYAQERGLPLIAVQHHHGHIAAVAAEHRLEGPLLGLALDGLGLGSDGTLWGGELLRVEGAQFRRLGHLATLPLPGGDRAAREPWRLAAAALYRLGRGSEIESRFADQPGAATVRQMLERRLNCPETSSAGRLFDAAAGILGVKPVAAFEAQPAMMLEALAEGFDAPADEPALMNIDEGGVLDSLPLLARLLELDDPAFGATLFHTQLLQGLTAWVLDARARTGLDTLAMAGGCLLNAILANGLRQRLEAEGMRVITAERLPCNDGGLSLGQAWVAINTNEGN